MKFEDKSKTLQLFAENHKERPDSRTYEEIEEIENLPANMVVGTLTRRDKKDLHIREYLKVIYIENTYQLNSLDLEEKTLSEKHLCDFTYFESESCFYVLADYSTEPEKLPPIVELAWMLDISLTGV